MVKFEVPMSSKISESMIHFNLSSNISWNYVTHASISKQHIEIIWNFYDKFMDPDYVTTSIRRTIGAFSDIIWIMIP